MNKSLDALGYYKILNVDPQESFDKIKKQYYVMAKFWHPDQNKSPTALEKFQKVSVAYDILKDANSRIQYDLLSSVYDEKDFPQIGSLKIYKNQQDREDLALRVLRQQKTYPNWKKTEIKESKDVCNFQEAAEMVLSTSLHNWLCGWWGKGAISKNISALKFNYANTNVRNEDNLKLMIHNMLAYAQENMQEQAYIYGMQASMMVNKNSLQYQLINKFLSNLSYSEVKIDIPCWSGNELKRRQLLVPSVLFLLLLTVFLFLAINNGLINFSKINTDSYFEQREFSGGVLMPYDMIDAHIVKIDSAIDSMEFIYHLNDNCTIYYGPDIRYDIMRSLKKGQTVRVIGYTGNQKWMKILLDNGEAGFVQRKFLSSGMGNAVPQNSKVYQK